MWLAVGLNLNCGCVNMQLLTAGYFNPVGKGLNMYSLTTLPAGEGQKQEMVLSVPVLPPLLPSGGLLLLHPGHPGLQ